MKKEAKEWVRVKVMSEIIGICCDISNAHGHKYPFKDYTYYDSRSYQKLLFLLSNFSDFIDIYNIVDDHYSINGNRSQWSTEYHKATFKLYINHAIGDVRQIRLNEIGV